MAPILDLKKIIVNAAIVLFFAAMLVTTQLSGIAASLVWYTALAFGLVAALYSCDLRPPKTFIAFALLVAATGAVNLVFTGTTTPRTLFLLLTLCVISLLFSSDDASEWSFLIALGLNMLMIMFRFATVGFHGEIYTNASTNFVSVYLLYPTVMYYITLERKGRHIPWYPAAAIWLFSLLSRGRGGILATSLLLLGIMLIVFIRSADKWKLLIVYAGIFALGMLILNADVIAEKLGASVMTEYFRNRGFRSSSRIRVWTDYLSRSFSSVKNALLGTNISSTLAGTTLKGNPHNSFINIHTYNGMLMLLVVIFLEARNALLSFVRGHRVFTLCLLVMLLRSFTDMVFWPSYGSPVLFFMLLAEFPDRRGRSQIPRGSAGEPEPVTAV